MACPRRVGSARHGVRPRVVSGAVAASPCAAR
jgi:hypothetical protein